MPQGLRVADRRAVALPVEPRQIAAPGADHAQPAALGNGCCQGAACDVAHRSQHHRMVDAEHLGQRCAQPHALNSRKPTVSAVADPAGCGRTRCRSARRRTAAWSAVCVRCEHRLAVDLLDQQRLHAARHRPDRRAPPAAAWWASASSVKVSSVRPPRSRNHASSPSTSATSAPALRPGRCAPSRPRQRRAVRVGGIRGGEHDGLVLAALRIDAVEVGPQPVHGGRDRELGAAQRLDEVAALAPARILERGEHLVEHRESAGHTLGRDRALRQHAVAVEQQLGLEVRPHGRFRFGRRERRPPARDGRVGGAGLRVRDAVAAQPRRSLAAGGAQAAAIAARCRRATPAPGRTCRR